LELRVAHVGEGPALGLRVGCLVTPHEAALIVHHEEVERGRDLATLLLRDAAGELDSAVDGQRLALPGNAVLLGDVLAHLEHLGTVGERGGGLHSERLGERNLGVGLGLRFGLEGHTGALVGIQADAQKGLGAVGIPAGEIGCGLDRLDQTRQSLRHEPGFAGALARRASRGVVVDVDLDGVGHDCSFGVLGCGVCWLHRVPAMSLGRGSVESTWLAPCS
jgi:hypothetical protein